MPRSAFATAIGSGAWWRAQIMIVCTEVLLSFLALMGIARGLDLPWIAAGMCLTFVLSGLIVQTLAAGARKTALGVTLTCIGSASVFFVSDNQFLAWMGLAVSCGLLLGCRDTQTVANLASIPVMAARGGQSIRDVGQWTYILGTIHSLLWITISGWVLTIWPQWPIVVLGVVVIVGLPSLIFSTPKNTRSGLAPKMFPRNSELAVTWKRKLNHLYRLAFWANAVSFLGQRFLIPVLLSGLMAFLHMDKQAFGWFGTMLAAITVIGLIGSWALARKWPKLNLLSEVWVMRSVEGMVLGWLMVVLGSVVVQDGFVHGWWLVLSGMIVVDVSGRLWGGAYLDTLRRTATLWRHTHSRGHRKSLRKFMLQKSRGSALAFASAGLAMPFVAGAAPILVGVMTGILWRTVVVAKKEKNSLS